MSDNPYQSPEYAAAPPPAGYDPVDAHQDDITLTHPTGMVKAGAILAIVTGLITLLVGFQLIVAVDIYHEVLKYVPYVLMIAGAGTMFMGWKTMKTLGWASIGITAASGLLTLGMGYWVLLSAASGFFSLLAMLLPPLALISTVFAGLGISHCLRADDARRRLREAGVDLNF